MGFPDVRAIKRALKLSNGDVNEAVTFLTEQPLTSYSTVDDLRDVEMADPALRPPSYDEVSYPDICAMASVSSCQIYSASCYMCL